MRFTAARPRIFDGDKCLLTMDVCQEYEARMSVVDEEKSELISDFSKMSWVQRVVYVVITLWTIPFVTFFGAIMIMVMMVMMVIACVFMITVMPAYLLAFSVGLNPNKCLFYGDDNEEDSEEDECQSQT